MSTERHEIAIREEVNLTIRDLEDSFAIAVRQRQLLEEYIKERLTPGKHFYRVQGAKNSLTKEGAELICLPHGYRPSYYKEGGPDQPPSDNTPYQITVRCRLLKAESFAGEGLGSASSYITTKSGDYKPRQNDPGLCHNATLKMAQKSAYIAATLNATAASEFFTQDIEDGDEVAPRPDATPPAKGGEYWCETHQTEWFKRGNMRNYAHPDGEGWCNMPKEAPVRAAPSSTPTTVSGAAPTPTSEPPSGTPGLVSRAIADLHYGDRGAVLRALGCEKVADILPMYGTTQAAWDVLRKSQPASAPVEASQEPEKEEELPF